MRGPKLNEILFWVNRQRNVHSTGKTWLQNLLTKLFNNFLRSTSMVRLHSRTFPYRRGKNALTVCNEVKVLSCFWHHSVKRVMNQEKFMDSGGH